MTATGESDGLRRVTKARAQLVQISPFFGSLALHLKLETGGAECPTMATDGKRLIVNDDFVASLSDPQLRGVVVHEVLHCAYQHMTRRGARDPYVWNMAADYAINLDVIDSGFELPEGGLLDERFRGMAAESIYAELIREGQKAPSGGAPGNDPGGCGGVIDAPEGEKAEVEQDWKGKASIAAAIVAKGCSKIPAAMERLVGSLQAPKVSWREILRRFVSDSITKDYSFSRPNRRFIAQGLYLPSLISNGRGHVAVVIDTSGSIDVSALQAFLSEVQELLNENVADRITVITCNCKVQDVFEFQSGDAMQMQIKGGGGTDFAPAIDWIAGHAPDAACAIYFTDLLCSSYGQEPGLPVIWANWSLEAKEPPFGEVIQLDAHE